MTKCGTCGGPLPHPDTFCETCCYPGLDLAADHAAMAVLSADPRTAYWEEEREKHRAEGWAACEAAITTWLRNKADEVEPKLNGAIGRNKTIAARLRAIQAWGHGLADAIESGAYKER